VGNDSLVIAKDRLEAVLKGDKNEPLEYRVIKEMSGTDLDGLSYKQLWNAPVKDIGPHATLAIGSFNDSSAENFEPG